MLGKLLRSMHNGLNANEQIQHFYMSAVLRNDDNCQNNKNWIMSELLLT